MILFTPLMEPIRSFERPILTRATCRHTPEDGNLFKFNSFHVSWGFQVPAKTRPRYDSGQTELSSQPHPNHFRISIVIKWPKLTFDLRLAMELRISYATPSLYRMWCLIKQGGNLIFTCLPSLSGKIPRWCSKSISSQQTPSVFLTHHRGDDNRFNDSSGSVQRLIKDWCLSRILQLSTIAWPRQIIPMVRPIQSLKLYQKTK
jgi:hypothetical protein